jgi:hypothetical protein
LLRYLRIWVENQDFLMVELSNGGTLERALQIMTTEHFVLQTARAATIQEANQRASLFLTSVSSATIALAFVAQVTQIGGPFVLFSLIVLPCLCSSIRLQGAGVLVTSVAGSGRAPGVVVAILLFASSVFLLRRYHIRAWAAAERKLTTLFPVSNDPCATP